MKGDEKLALLRILMRDKGYDAYIIPHGDQHDNEYVAEPDERIKFISNFSGSNAFGLITNSVALIWTDGIYYIQIERELYSQWKMKKMGEEESLIEYILKYLPKKSKIGMDYSLFTHEIANEMKIILNDYEFNDNKDNLIDKCWGKLKPKYSINKVFILPVEFTGKSVLDKYKQIDEFILINLKINNNYRMLIPKLDDIAWFLNLRGNDIPYNPIFFSYALFYKTSQGFCTHLFVNKEKFNTKEFNNYCIENNIKLFDYTEISKELKTIPEGFVNIVDEKSTNHRMYIDIINSKQKTFFIEEDIIENIKSIKNPIEILGFKKANLKDCVALIKFFSWLEEELVTKKRKDLNEYEIGKKNKEIREEQENYMGESFAPICASGKNAAIIHYQQKENLNSDTNKDLILLCDTGAHYKEGTTDITRTVHYGIPSRKEKEMYTRVLLGNICLERLIFKKGYTLKDIDCVPRSYLFIVGEDYLHGTSHGVGHFLNVHEGPMGKPLKPGNIITNEPGYYEKNSFGIRIENEILVVEKGGNKLGFENLTFLPYERNLIDINFISNDFIKYIDDYHRKVFELLCPFLKNDNLALNYLTKKTAPLNNNSKCI